MSYYERWVAAVIELAIASSLVTREEVQRGKPARGSVKATPPLTADKVLLLEARGASARRNVTATPPFLAGQSVRARNMHPPGHTRLPRYPTSIPQTNRRAQYACHCRRPSTQNSRSRLWNHLDAALAWGAKNEC